MSRVVVRDLQVKFGKMTALEGINLAIEPSEIVAILGPSGCGKTTLLRSIAGLLPVSGGSIEIEGTVVSSPGVNVPPERRNIGWVPQDSSLFPHLSVAENIGFGLPRRVDTSTTSTDHTPLTRAERIDQLARMVGLSDHLQRTPAQLSGGQAQRVSLARALATHPTVLLLDEPFAALDPMLRVALRTEVMDLLRREQATAVIVTHDQEEALSLSDHVAVMMGGRLLQWGTPAEVYERPATSWVARFVGSTVELAGRLVDENSRAENSLTDNSLTDNSRAENSAVGPVVDCALGKLPAVVMEPEVTPGAPVRVVLRPEWLAITPTKAADQTTPPADHTTPPTGVVVAATYMGHDALVTVQLPDGSRIKSRTVAATMPAVGETVQVSVQRPALVYR